MKKIILTFVFFACIYFLNAQDTSIIKYLPLKVGNIWIYNWTTVVPPTTGKVKLKISGTTTANGHTYFIFQQTGNTCSCPFTTSSPFLITLGPMRVDSNSGNILLSGGSCQWLPYEILLDSLKKRIGDSLKYPCNTTICGDTSLVNVFGISRRTKYFTNYIMTYYLNRKYAKDIGLIFSSQGCPFNIHCDYNLQGCVLDGIVYGDTSFPVGLKQISSEVPEEFSLSQNYPNPFNPTTKIRFDIPPRAKAGQVMEGGRGRSISIIIYDILGREIQTFVNEKLSSGTYEVEFDGTNYSSGMYYYTLSADEFTQTKRMVLLR